MRTFMPSLADPFLPSLPSSPIKATANGISNTRSCRLEDGSGQALNLDKPDCKRTCLACIWSWQVISKWNREDRCHNSAELLF